MARKGQFKKGGGRHGGHAIVRYRTKNVIRYRTRSPKKHRRRGRRRGGGMLGAAGAGLGALLPLAGVGAAVGYVTGEGNVDAFAETMKKIPGVKTVGLAAGTGIAALIVNKYLFRNRWLKLAGVVGVIAGAYEIGKRKFDVKWVGDPDDGLVSDVG